MTENDSGDLEKMILDTIADCKKAGLPFVAVIATPYEYSAGKSSQFMKQPVREDKKYFMNAASAMKNAYSGILDVLIKYTKSPQDFKAFVEWLYTNYELNNPEKFFGEQK